MPPLIVHPASLRSEYQLFANPHDSLSPAMQLMDTIPFFADSMAGNLSLSPVGIFLALGIPLSDSSVVVPSFRIAVAVSFDLRFISFDSSSFASLSSARALAASF